MVCGLAVMLFLYSSNYVLALVSTKLMSEMENSKSTSEAGALGKASIWPKPTPEEVKAAEEETKQLQAERIQMLGQAEEMEKAQKRAEYYKRLENDDKAVEAWMKHKEEMKIAAAITESAGQSEEEAREEEQKIKEERDKQAAEQAAQDAKKAAEESQAQAAKEDAEKAGEQAKEVEVAQDAQQQAETVQAEEAANAKQAEEDQAKAKQAEEEMQKAQQWEEAEKERKRKAQEKRQRDRAMWKAGAFHNGGGASSQSSSEPAAPQAAAVPTFPFR